MHLRFIQQKLLELKLKSNRFSIISEMITKLLHSDVTYCEIPAFFASSLRKRRTVTLKILLMLSLHL